MFVYRFVMVLSCFVSQASLLMLSKVQAICIGVVFLANVDWREIINHLFPPASPVVPTEPYTPMTDAPVTEPPAVITDVPMTEPPAATGDPRRINSTGA
jgi:hypothetical protein